ncbi:ComEC/Rec2 family competence protein [Patescibacteria group bacterium]
MNKNRFFTKSKVFLYLNLGFILGIFLGRNLEIKLWLFFVILFGLLFICLINKKLLILPFVFCLLTFGVYYYQKNSPQDFSEENLAYYNDQGKQTFEGIIASNPYTQNGNQKFVVKGIDLKGKALVSTFAYPKFKYGDKIKITSKLKTPIEFEDFSYKNYLALQDIYSVCYWPKIELIDHDQGNVFYQFIYKLKNYLESKVNYILPEPTAAFLNGLLFGSRKSIPENLMNDFNTTGLTHIIAISGWNITIIANILMKFFGFLPRKYSFWVVILGISFFAIFVGGQAAVVRAAIMGILTFWALKSGRLKGITNGVLLTATIMLLINPKILQFDAGFQLSFLATLGILYFYPFLEKILKWLPNFFEIRETAIVTLSAQVFALPLIIFTFKRLSIISPFANILILPLIPYAMLLGFIANLVAVLWGGLGRFLGVGVFLILHYITSMVHFLAKFQFASIEIGKFSIFWVIGYYLCLGWLLWFLNKREKKV